jgi:chromate transporter
MAGISIGKLAITYLRIGNTTFGGGDPTMMALQRDLVEHKRVLSADEFSLSYALARATPGTNILAFCAGTGWQLRGWMGALIAVIAVGVPSSVVAVFFSGAYQVLDANPVGRSAISSTLAAAVGLMFAGAWLLIRPRATPVLWPRTTLFVAGSFALIWWAHLSPLQVMGIAAVVGLLWREPRPR